MVVQQVLPNDRYRVADMGASKRVTRKSYNWVVVVDRMKPWATPGGVSDDTDDDSGEDDRHGALLLLRFQVTSKVHLPVVHLGTRRIAVWPNVEPSFVRISFFFFFLLHSVERDIASRCEKY